jgi:hypothetical protein
VSRQSIPSRAEFDFSSENIMTHLDFCASSSFNPYGTWFLTVVPTTNAQPNIDFEMIMFSASPPIEITPTTLCTVPADIQPAVDAFNLANNQSVSISCLEDSLVYTANISALESKYFVYEFDTCGTYHMSVDGYNADVDIYASLDQVISPIFGSTSNSYFVGNDSLTLGFVLVLLFISFLLFVL